MTETTSGRPARRLVSVDALRGFDMFWLVGGTGFGLGIARLCSPAAREFLQRQFEHSDWAGCTFYDVIYPLFVFIVGMSVVFSLQKYKDERRTFAAYRRMLRRFVLMFALGLLYYGAFREPWPGIRLLGVLQRLALCYLAAGLLFYHCKPRTLIGICAGILVGYWILFTFIPVPGAGRGAFGEGANWARYVDEQFLPGKTHDGTWDNNGLLSTLPAISSCLLGVLAALWIANPSISDKKRVAGLLLGGLLMAALGWTWGFQFPVIKKIWTSSYVLVAGGYSLMFLGAFYLVADVWLPGGAEGGGKGHRSLVRIGLRPFIWIGANPLTIYLARNIVDFNALADRFVGGSIAAAVGPDVGYLLHTSVSLLLSMLLVWYLYRKGIFLRV